MPAVSKSVPFHRVSEDAIQHSTAYYAREYDLVAVEDLNVKWMPESPRNSRNTASAAWNAFTDLLEYKCKREDTHFVEVEPEGTTKECAQGWRGNRETAAGA